MMLYEPFSKAVSYLKQPKRNLTVFGVTCGEDFLFFFFFFFDFNDATWVGETILFSSVI